MWQAVYSRDRGADGSFVYGVRSTGVYCRPSCPSRRPKPENIVFFTAISAAEVAGFRSCKRCRPELGIGVRREAIVAACRVIEARIEEGAAAPTVCELSAVAGFNSQYFQKLFKVQVGLSPRAYAVALRARRVAMGLSGDRASTVTQAILEAGYGSCGRFYDGGATKRLGMAPKIYKEHGVGQVVEFAIGRCWLGVVAVAATQRGICAVRLGDDGDELAAGIRKTFVNANVIEGGEGLQQKLEAVLVALEYPGTAADLPLDIQGTVFEQKVWAALRAIPAGETRTYGEIAAAIGAPKAVRAVGRACGANPVAVLTPCHRVVGQGGKLTGYRWGIARKAALLKRENDG